MSQIYLSRNEDDNPRVVVGWDRPSKTYFWQIFNPMPASDPVTGEQEWDEWEELSASGGNSPYEIETIADLRAQVPDEVRVLITPKVVETLASHRLLTYPASNQQVDLTGLP